MYFTVTFTFNMYKTFNLYLEPRSLLLFYILVHWKSQCDKSTFLQHKKTFTLKVAERSGENQMIHDIIYVVGETWTSKTRILCFVVQVMSLELKHY